MSLATDLASANAANRARIPDSALEVMDAATAGTAIDELAVGETAPDFTLPNATGEPVTLSTALEDGPVILSFYRGGWCPYCNLELRALQSALSDLEDAGATLIAVSPQTPDASLTTAEKNDLEFAVLSDVGLRGRRGVRPGVDVARVAA